MSAHAAPLPYRSTLCDARRGGVGDGGSNQPTQNVVEPEKHGYTLIAGVPGFGTLATKFFLLTLPSVGTDRTRRWYGQYQALVRTVPSVGTDSTKRWYGQYQALVRTVPGVGTDNTKRWYGRYQALVGCTRPRSRLSALSSRKSNLLQNNTL